MLATRNTCFALLSAMELDMRSLVRRESELASLSSFLPDDVRQSAFKRWRVDNKSHTVDAPTDDGGLLDYIDFCDLSKVMAGGRDLFKNVPPALRDFSGSAIVKLTAVRNRVCHSRPLEPDDFSTCLDFSTDLLKFHGDLFPILRDARSRLDRDPSHVLQLQIPSFWQHDAASAHHNLPLPEFDDTGFLGRATDRHQIIRLLRSHHPVVTIVGEGGVGKTAIALRCLYDLLDQPDQPYDAVVWCSLKVSALTPDGVIQLNSAVASSLGLFRAVVSALGSPMAGDMALADATQELQEYLSSYRILLAIDNLETLAGFDFRDFIIGLPPGSKLLLTSRVGLGEFEIRYVLDAMEPAGASALMRTFAQVLGQSDIWKQDEGRLRKYCKTLFHNPLLIKWYVSSVARGLDPQRLLDRGGSGLAEALSYCLATLFDKLSLGERQVVYTLASVRHPVSSAELYFLLASLKHEDIELALATLQRSSIVRRSAVGGDSCLYQLSEAAGVYIDQSNPPDKVFYANIQARLKDMRLMIEGEHVKQAAYSYEVMSVRTRTRDERIAAVYLRHALDELGRRHFEQARVQVAEAKTLLPTYSETWRISALVESESGEHYRASKDLDRAVELDPHSTIVRYQYAMFLMRAFEDSQAALQHLTEAERIDPDSTTILGMKAWALVRLGRYEEAANIYAPLLVGIMGQAKRWRIATRDQAAECYRRWAERDLENRDDQGFRDHIKQAFAIIGESVIRGDADSKTRQRTGKVMKEALWYAANRNDKAFAHECLERVESIVRYFPEGCITIADLSRYTALFADDHELCDRLEGAVCCYDPLLDKNATIATLGTSEHGSQRDRRLGTVVNLQADKGYGFLEDAHGQRWFFHRSCLIGECRWDGVRMGMQMSFNVGANDKGPCAVDVCDV